MRMMIKALLAATALMPVAVQAQDWHGGDRRAEARNDGDHRGQARPGPAPQAVQPQSRPAPQPHAQQQFRGGGRGDAGVQIQAQQRGSDGRVDRSQGGGRWGGFRGNAQPQVQVQPQVQQQQRDQGFPPDRGNDGASFRGGVAAQAQVQGDRRNDPRGYDNRGGYRPSAQGRPDRQGGQGWNGNDRTRAGNWNRGWREDNRYDWNRYRSINRGAYRLPRYYAPYGWGYGYRRFSIGVTLSAVLFGENYWIDDPYAYRLPDAYGPYRWVRYYDDALLVDVRSGQVVDVVYDIFD